MSAPVLETPRLVLRPVNEHDANELHALFVAPGVRRFLWDDRIIPHQQTLDIIAESRRLFVRDGYGLWMVSGREPAARPIGFAGLWSFRDPPELELLFGIAEEWWGQGIAAEAARAVIGYACNRLGLPNVNASTDAANGASIRVLEKLGMRRTRQETIGGLDTVFFAIAASECAE